MIVIAALAVGVEIAQQGASEMTDHEPHEWLIRKGDLFYRPNCSGYTAHKHDAGRYTKAKAEAEASVEPWQMKAIHQDDWPDDLVSKNYKDKDARIATLAVENERLKVELASANERSRMLLDAKNHWKSRTEASAAVKVLQEIRHLSRLDNALSDGANAAIMSRMADIHQHADAALTTEPAAPQVAEAVAWHRGEPPKPWCDEWFIAMTTYGDRVVLRSLPEDWAYDYKTADDTYIKADKIKAWMQFPDSQFVEFAHSPSQAVTEAQARHALAEREALTAAQEASHSLKGEKP